MLNMNITSILLRVLPVVLAILVSSAVADEYASTKSSAGNSPNVMASTDGFSSGTATPPDTDSIMGKRFKTVPLAVLSTTMGLLAPIPNGADVPHSIDDAWDVAQGVKVTSNSKALSGNEPLDMFGQRGSRNGQNHNPGVFIFDNWGAEHFVEWKTPSPVSIRAFELILIHDGDIPRRAISKFRLLGFAEEGGEFVELYSTDIKVPYQTPPKHPMLTLRIDLPSTFVGKQFRAEFQSNENYSHNGPRIVELDGYAVAFDDLIEDAWQEKYFGTNFMHNPDAGADADPDKDGLTNLQEYRMWVDPTISAARIEPSSIDLWDISTGIEIIEHGGLIDENQATGMFGATKVGSKKSASTVFRGGQTDGFVHYIEWMTPTNVPVKVINLRARHKGGPDYRGAIREFRFYARDPDSANFKLVESRAVSVPYSGPTENSLALSIVLSEALTNKHFRAEFVQHGGAQRSGPRILELDAFAMLPLDAIDDDWQIEFFGAAYLSSTLAAPETDADSDGATNEQEFFRGTVPTNAKSGVVAHRMAPVITWKSEPGAVYRVTRVEKEGFPKNFIVAEAFRATKSVSSLADPTATNRNGSYIVEKIENSKAE